MLGRSSRSRNFFRKLVVNGVNNSKTQSQNNCLMRLYDADVELKAISNELDSFDGKKDPIRCNLLVNQLRTAQDKVIGLLFQLMDDCSCERASRDYRMKFPDEILLSEGSESLNGQIWFGAECLSAGSNILHHTKESTMLRPMAKTLTNHLDSLRNELRNLVLDGDGAAHISPQLIKKMVTFDHIFATFEYEYVRTMLPIRTVVEIEKLQDVAVLFSETLIDCLKRGLIKQDDIDEFQPIVMIAIPRLAIVRGLLYKNENPIYTRHKSQMCSLFQPFHGPLHSIRRLLRGLSPQELFSLEKMLANDQTATESPFQATTASAVGDVDKSEPTSIKKDISKEEEPLQQSKEDSGDQYCCMCRTNENEASTSNNFSNALMDGLSYPIGQKISDDDSSTSSVAAVNSNQPTSANRGNEPNDDYSCCFAEASSSKAVADKRSSDNSPVGSTPSTSSSSSSILSSSVYCEDCRTEKSEGSKNNLENHDCDKHCCKSLPESDAQLEKLIAEFSIEGQQQGLAHQETKEQQQSTNETTTTTSITAVCAKNDGIDSDLSCKQTDLSKVDGDEALLEELFLKQAQQLLHRLFVAISGVADQLQSNFAADLRFILRHIFSSEIEGTNGDDNEEEDDDELDDDDEDDESDGREQYSNNEQSDGSLPIEQGIEAQEVANLIDLSSGGGGYFVDSSYDYHQDLRLVPPPPPAGNYSSYLGTTTEVDMNRHSPGSSLYASVATHQRSNDSENASSQAFQDTLNQDVNEEILADLMRAADQTELIYESRSSPNEISIMDDTRRRQQLIQQHLQSISRASTRSASRSHRSHGGQSGYHHRGSSEHERVSRNRGSRTGSRRIRGPPVWVPDQLVVACSCCNASFTLFRRRHHCRACGQIFCAECSKFTKNLNCWGYNGPVRVCESCFNQP